MLAASATDSLSSVTSSRFSSVVSAGDGGVPDAKAVEKQFEKVNKKVKLRFFKLVRHFLWFHSSFFPMSRGAPRHGPCLRTRTNQGGENQQANGRRGKVAQH